MSALAFGFGLLLASTSTSWYSAEQEALTNAYWKAASSPEFLAKLDHAPSSEHRLVASMLRRFSPDYLEQPGTCASEASLAKSDEILQQLLVAQPDHLWMRVMAFDRCVKDNSACAGEHATELVLRHPDNALGALLLAHLALKAGDRERALRWLGETTSAREFGMGFGTALRVVTETLEALSVEAGAQIDGGRRDLALHDIGTILIAPTDIGFHLSLQTLCRSPASDLEVAACLAGARALRLPGSNVLLARIGLVLEEKIHRSRGDADAMARLVRERTEYEHLVGSVSQEPWKADPEQLSAFIAEHERHGQLRAIQLFAADDKGARN